MTSVKDTDSPLNALEDEIRPKTKQEELLRFHQSRARQLSACLRFRDYVSGIIFLNIIVGLIARIAFAIVNLVSIFNPVSHPIWLAAAYTGVVGLLLAIFTIVDMLYATENIGCSDTNFTPAEMRALRKTEYAYFQPGCFYDCRRIQNIVDVNSLRLFLFLTYVISVFLYWGGGNVTDTPNPGTEEGVRFINSHSALLAVEVLSIVCIVENIYAIIKQRPNIETVRIKFWFEIERWSDTHM